MEMFSFGILAGVIISLITIGSINISTNKEEQDKHDNVNHLSSKSVDKFNKDIKKISDHAKKLGVKLDNE